MKNANTLPLKRRFLFITIAILLVYLIFFVICYKFQFLPVIYSKKTCQTYYVLSYVLLTASAYAIDTQKKKDPVYLSVFAIPFYSFVFLFMAFMSASMDFIWIAVMTLIIGLIILGLFFIYKKLLPKLINVKYFYSIGVLVYVLLMMTLTLYLGLIYLA